MGYYPIILDLTDKDCLIVGGGEVALRKAQALREAGARVVVIAPEVDQRLEMIDGVRALRRGFQAGDTAGYTLVFAATDDRELNAAVSREAQERGTPVNVVDDPELCSFIVPSLVRRGDLLIATTTSGKSPALSKRIRKELEQRYRPEYAQLVDLLGSLRDEVKAAYPAQSQREAAFNRLIDCGLLELLREGKEHEARKRALQCISEQPTQ